MSDHNPNLDNYKVVAEDGNEYGPVSAELVQAWLKQGVIDRHSMVKKEGDDQWHALLNFAELQPGPPVLDAPPPAGGSEPAPDSPATHFGETTPPTPDYFQDPAQATPKKGLRTWTIVGLSFLGFFFLMGLGVFLVSDGEEIEKEAFTKMHKEYQTRIFPMELDAVLLVERIQGTRDDRVAIQLMREIGDNLAMRNLALQTIDLQNSKIDELNKEYIQYCEAGQQMWSEAVGKFEKGDLKGGTAVLQGNLKSQTDQLAKWVIEFNLQCETHGLPNLEAIMEKLAEDM